MEMTTATLNAVANGGGGGQKTVLITGVSRGLGRALAVEMAKRGHSVIGCSRSQDKLKSLQSDLSSSSEDNKHLFLNLDVVSFLLLFIHFISFHFICTCYLLYVNLSFNFVDKFTVLSCNFYLLRCFFYLLMK